MAMRYAQMLDGFERFQIRQGSAESPQRGMLERAPPAQQKLAVASVGLAGVCEYWLSRSVAFDLAQLACVSAREDLQVQASAVG